ncbi:hypothetical protein K1T71_006540 [Dendrolimus kikuchii]|uniref:Uncharacterized protein n=1 Tax=Dendrolimus kikuchii TaxID=765133 RepID=A0ACC1D2Q1_9NEOP|nr:hypothetical protein K1T71_006540 [Dendrolimus kikuchii]
MIIHFLCYQLIKLVTGSELIMYQNYTFSFHTYQNISLMGKSVILYRNYTYSRRGVSGKHQYCSRKSTMRCNAKVTLNDDGSIRAAHEIHNHPPPQLMKLKSGHYIKI